MDSTSLAAWTEILHWKVPWEYVWIDVFWCFFDINIIQHRWYDIDILFIYALPVLYSDTPCLIVKSDCGVSHFVYLTYIIVDDWNSAQHRMGWDVNPLASMREKKVNRDPGSPTKNVIVLVMAGILGGGAPQWMGRYSHETARNPSAELGIMSACLVMYTVGRWYPPETNMTLENPHFQLEIRLHSWWMFFLVMLVFGGI